MHGYSVDLRPKSLRRYVQKRQGGIHAGHRPVDRFRWSRGVGNSFFDAGQWISVIVIAIAIAVITYIEYELFSGAGGLSQMVFRRG